MYKTTLNTHSEFVTLERKFSPDILAFLNSISESDIRRLMNIFQREQKSRNFSKTSKACQAYALLEKNPMSEIKEDSTQLLREIRDDE
jgi:hypothetical protein